MSETLTVDQWLGYLSTEYLTTYVRDGGAAVKFAVAEGGLTSSDVAARLKASAGSAGITPFTLNAAEVKVHLVDRVFFACASQVPWPRLTDYVLRRLANDEGFSAPATTPEGASFAQAVADASGIDVDFVRQRLTLRIQDQVFRDRAMVRDFRYAMTWMCQNRLTGSPSMAADAALLEQWLTGQLVRIGQLKQQAIFTKINRTNARLHFESLLHWLRKALIPGTMVIFDLDRLVDGGPRQEGGERYTRAALLDAYEVLRQFIDSVDEMEGVLLVAVAHEGILDPDRRGRGFGSYHALRNRVYDEVRDRTHANPAGSLVRLSDRPAS